MRQLKKTTRPWGWLIPLILAALVAYYVYERLLTALGTLWLAVPLTLLAAKIVADIVGWAVNRGLPFTYVEDYLRELLFFSLIGLVTGAVVYLSQRYLGGVVWVPLLAGSVVAVWNR